MSSWGLWGLDDRTAGIEDSRGPVMYHATSPRFRDSIQQSGLRIEHSEDDPSSIPGIYMSPKPSPSPYSDVWAVDTSLLRHLEPDDPAQMQEFQDVGGSYWTKHDVPLEALSLHQKATQTHRWGLHTAAEYGEDLLAVAPKLKTPVGNLLNLLSGEFNDWLGGQGDWERANGIQDWVNVENFMKEKYPAAHRGLQAGLEEAEPLLDGKPLPKYCGDCQVDLDSDGYCDCEEKSKNVINPQPISYETGINAHEKYGYDPKEIAAAMVLLHSHGRKFRDNFYFQKNLDRLNDIAQKRFQMQRNYEHHTASTDGIRYAHIVEADVAEDLRRLAGVRTAAHEHVESGQRGRPDWTGCAHPECRPDLPTTMYHVSHPKNRDSIARHGLLTSYSEDDDFSDELGMPHGIYMTSDEPKPSHDTERWPGDVWAIDTTRLRHLENDFPGGMLFRNAFATKYDVPPEAMRLHRPSAHHTARLAMPSRDAYDDTVMNSKRKTDDIPEQGEFYHGSNHEHQPGDILESVRARGDQDRLDYYQRSIGAPNHADWVWMYNHPAPATKYHKNVYQLEPLDEGPWIWNNIKRDDGQFRPTENDQDFPRLVSPRARVIRKLTPEEHAAAGQHLNDTYERYRAERDARTSRLAAHPKRPTNWPPDGGWQPRDEGDGMMTLYHRTSPENADEIIKGQRFLPGKKFYPNEPDKWQYPPTSDQTWFATSPQGRTTGGYDERGYEKYGPAVVKVRVPKEKVYYPAEWFGVKPGDDVHAYVYPEDLDGLPITRHATTKTAMPAPLPKGVYFRYHPELMWSPGVTAHLPGGKQVGSLEWYDDDHVMVDLGSRKPGEIDRIAVHPDHQGQSIATSMFDFAKQYEPRLHHSETLTDDGRGWSEYERSRNARLAMAWQDWAPHIQNSLPSRTYRNYTECPPGGGCEHPEAHGRYWIDHTGNNNSENSDNLSRLNYRHTRNQFTGQPQLQIQALVTHPNHQRDGVAEALIRRLHQDHPDTPISTGDMTRDGYAFYNRMLEKEPDARSAVTAGKNGPPPPMTFEPFNTMWTNGIMARHAEDGRPLAHLHWYPDGEIETIRVHPEMRGRGVGKEILMHAAAHPETYEAEDGIKPSNTLTPDGRAFARSLGHDPSDEEVTPAEGEHQWAWKAVQNYVPMHIPYTGQNEDEMSRYLDKPWTSTRTAASGDGWPVWWRGRQRPAVPFDKRWHPNHPEHIPSPWDN